MPLRSKKKHFLDHCFHGDTSRWSVFYSTLPLQEGEIIWNTYWFIKDVMFDYILDQATCPVDHWKYYNEVNVRQELKKDFTLGHGFESEDFKAISFIRSRSFHDQTHSHEIVTLHGIYPDLDCAFFADGVGYAGTIVLTDAK